MKMSPGKCWLFVQSQGITFSAPSAAHIYVRKLWAILGSDYDLQNLSAAKVS